MKWNLILFGVFALLLGGTYLFQEKRAEHAYQEALTKDLLIQEEITHLKLPALEAEKKNGKWWSGKDLMSHNGFNQMEKKLRELKKIKEIKGEWANYFPHPFLFEVNHVPWAIGDLSLDKQGFYVARGKEIFLAVVEGESQHLTTEEEEIEAIKLNELISALSKPRTELLENQLFRFYTNLPLERILVSTDGALPFELNLEKNETLPPPIPGVSAHSDLRGKFFSLLTQVTLKEEIPYSEKERFRKMGEIKFIGPKNSVSWELWLRNKKSADAIIVDSAQKKSWLMIGGTLKVFFVQVQDYWDKKVIPSEHFKSFTNLKMTLVQGPKSADVIIHNKEPLAFEVKGYHVDQMRMEQLMHFLFNLGTQDQANRVSQLSSSEKKMLLSGDHLRVELMGQELILWRKTQELIVANLTQGFKAHFTLMDENFHASFQDVLK